MSSGELDRKASGGAAFERPSSLAASGVEQAYSHADRLIDLLKKLRAVLRIPFYNRLASVAVVGGVFLATGSFWTELLFAVAGDYLKERFPDVYGVFSSAWQQYKTQIDNFNLIFGTILAALGLAYHWFAFKFDQELKFGQLKASLSRLDEDRKLDRTLIEKFSQSCPQSDFEKALAGIKTNWLNVVLLHSRFTFWTDPVNRFCARELDRCRGDIIAAHKGIATVFQRSEADAARGLDEALATLVKAYQKLDVNAAYHALESEIRSKGAG